MPKAQHAAPQTEVLRRSSAVHKRTVELYREKYPVPGAWLDEATYAECYRRAREECEHG